MTTINIPRLESDRLILRAFDHADHDALFAIESDEEMTRFTGGVHTQDSAWRFMSTMVGHWHLRGFGPFALEEKATGTLVGYCGPWFTPKFIEPEICYTLARSAQGKGFAGEALRRALYFAYEDLGWTTAMSVIDAKNSASQSVSRRMGAVKEQEHVPLGDAFVDIWRHLPLNELKQHP